MRVSGRLVKACLIVLSVAAISGVAAVLQFRAMVDATPPVDLFAPTSQVVTARNGDILRAYTVGDGLWRLPVDPARVDPGYVRYFLPPRTDASASIRASIRKRLSGLGGNS